MAVVPQQQKQTINWKQSAVEKAQVITDIWEIGKIYAGRLADWVLFVCMVANIIDVLPGVDYTPFVANIIIGTQAVTLDVAGFGLLSMAAHAEQQGAIKAAKRARATAILLITLMVITVTLITIGALFPEYKEICDQTEKGLILIRVVMTVIYGHIVHGLRDHSPQVQKGAVNPGQQAQFDELLNQFNQLRREVQGVQSQVQAQVQQAIAHLPRQVQEQVQQAVQGAVHPLVSKLAEQHKEGTIHPQRVQSQQVQPRNAEPPKVVQLTPRIEPRKGATEKGTAGAMNPQQGAGARVQQFVSEQLAKGYTPTLKEIMDACQCSKKTAIDNRRAIVGDSDDQTEQQAG